MPNQVRSQAVAGSFYPDNPKQLSQQIEAYLEGPSPLNQRPRCLIIPHAGYIYSGGVAATAYRSLKDYRSQIKKVLLMGPAHRLPVQGVAMSDAVYFESPLGRVELDGAAMYGCSVDPLFHINNEAHREEHCLEVHLPFLQTLFDDFLLFPLAVGRCPTKNLVEMIDNYMRDPEALLIVSSDLSHFHTYEEARAIDAVTASRIEGLEEGLNSEQACGSSCVNALILWARENNLLVKRLDLKNSGDSAGDKSRVVGYGSWAFV
jgi:AmmeMemoRadiSam system protein B